MTQRPRLLEQQLDAVLVRRSRRPRIAILMVALLAAGGGAACSPRVARLTNPAAPRCQASLRDAFELILVMQEEQPEVAEAMASSAVQAFTDVDLGPRPFKLSSPSGTDYAFFFDPEAGRCLLRLVGWQKAFVQYANNVTYVATRPLPGCRCEM